MLGKVIKKVDVHIGSVQVRGGHIIILNADDIRVELGSGHIWAMNLADIVKFAQEESEGAQVVNNKSNKNVRGPYKKKSRQRASTSKSNELRYQNNLKMLEEAGYINVALLSKKLDLQVYTTRALIREYEDIEKKKLADHKCGMKVIKLSDVKMFSDWVKTFQEIGYDVRSSSLEKAREALAMKRDTPSAYYHNGQDLRLTKPS